MRQTSRQLIKYTLLSLLSALGVALAPSCIETPQTPTKRQVWRGRVRFQLDRLSSPPDTADACQRLSSIYLHLTPYERPSFESLVLSPVISVIKKHPKMASPELVKLLDLLSPSGGESFLRNIHNNALATGDSGTFVATSLVMGSRQDSLSDTLQGALISWISGSGFEEATRKTRRFGCARLKEVLRTFLLHDPSPTESLLNNAGIKSVFAKRLLGQAAQATLHHTGCLSVDTKTQ